MKHIKPYYIFESLDLDLQDIKDIIQDLVDDSNWQIEESNVDDIYQSFEVSEADDYPFLFSLRNLRHQVNNAKNLVEILFLVPHKFQGDQWDKGESEFLKFIFELRPRIISIGHSIIESGYIDNEDEGFPFRNLYKLIIK